MVISISDFDKVDIRVGKIIEAKDFPNANKPAYQLTIDFGSEIGTKNSSAQITTLYTSDELVGKQILAVINFPPRQIANFFSEVLVLGVKQDDGSVVLLEPEREVSLGARVS
jgi:tRNA-binding protein